jgi:hypothetical protein
MKIIRIYICFVFIFCDSLANAHEYWPTFSYPDLYFFNSKDCLVGEVRLNANMSFNVGKNCNGLCPADWVWVISMSDGMCHRWTDIKFKGYKIKHFPEGIYWETSIITASFGAKNSGEIYFEMIIRFKFLTALYTKIKFSI